MSNNHLFHLVDYSPWPLTGALGAWSMMLGMIMWFHQYNMNLMMLSMIITLLTMYQWWRDIFSGISVTWAHHSIMENNHSNSIKSLLIMVILGIYFSILQGYEYIMSPFTIADSVYGASFLLATGFHGLHVIIRTLFLLVCLIRLMFFHFNSSHHFGFEAAAWCYKPSYQTSVFYDNGKYNADFCDESICMKTYLLLTTVSYWIQLAAWFLYSAEGPCVSIWH